MKHDKMMSNLRCSKQSIGSLLADAIEEELEGTVEDLREELAALTQAIDQLRWRSVEDELPAVGDTVLVVCTDFDALEMELGELWDNGWEVYNPDVKGNSRQDVTHWKPLPLPLGEE